MGIVNLTIRTRNSTNVRNAETHTIEKNDLEDHMRNKREGRCGYYKCRMNINCQKGYANPQGRNRHERLYISNFY